ncbi:MAG: T9SS type A sorting domain-containing protein, partial [Ignavibacterium sp.]
LTIYKHIEILFNLISLYQFFLLALSHSDIRSLYDIVSSVDEQSEKFILDQSILFQNYPNPFNSQTVISFQIKTAAIVKLEIYNLLGNKIQTLVDEYKGVGPYSESWDGKDENGLQVPTGIYFYRLRANDYTQTKKLLIIK